MTDGRFSDLVELHKGAEHGLAELLKATVSLAITADEQEARIAAAIQYIEAGWGRVPLYHSDQQHLLNLLQGRVGPADDRKGGDGP